MPWEPKTALVVDDDASVRDYVSTLLARAGITVELAFDGLEAENKLSAGKYDLLFLDMDMPRLSGMFILELLRRGKTGQPTWTVVMSGATDLAERVGDDWARLGIADVLTKPFGAADVTRVLERVKYRAQGTSRPIVIVGGGAWADALAKSVVEAGGLCKIVSAADALSALPSGPAVLVAGPPLKVTDIIGLCIQIPAERKAVLQVVAAIEEANATVRRDMLTIGARSIALPSGLPWLCDDVVRLAGLTPPPGHATFSGPVIMRAANGVYYGQGIKLAELHVAATFGDGAPAAPPFHLEFEVGGRLVESPCVIAGVESLVDGRMQVAFQLTALTEVDSQRIRRFIFESTS